MTVEGSSNNDGGTSSPTVVVVVVVIVVVIVVPFPAHGINSSSIPHDRRRVAHNQTSKQEERRIGSLSFYQAKNNKKGGRGNVPSFQKARGA